MFEDFSTVFDAVKEFLSAVFAIFEIDTSEVDGAASNASDVFEEAKKLFEAIQKLFNK